MRLPKPEHRIRAPKPIKRTSRPRKQRKTPLAKCYRLVMAAWEASIRSRSQHCVSGRPNHTGPIQAAHGFSRRYRQTSLHPDNGFSLCQACHCFYTHRPEEWLEWLRSTWGEEKYALLQQQRMAVRPITADFLRGSLVAIQADFAGRKWPTREERDEVERRIGAAAEVLWRDQR